MTARWSLRTRFVAFVAACLLPFLGVVLVVLNQNLNHNKGQVADAEGAVAAVVSQVLNTTLQDNEAVLTNLAADDAVRTMRPSAANDLLGIYKRARPSLTGLFLVNQSGQVVAFTRPDPNPLHNDLAPALGQVMDTGDPGVSKLLSAPVKDVSNKDKDVANVDVIAILVPVSASDQSTGQPIGVLGAFISVDRLKSLVLPFAQGDTAIAIVSKDQVIANQTATGLVDNTLTTRFAPQIAAALDGTTGTVTYQDQSGAQRLAVYAPIPSPGVNWAVLVTSPSPAAYSAGEVLFERGLAALGITVVVILGLAVLMGELTARPVRQLTDHAAALAQGDFSQRLDSIERGGEIGALGMAFQEMARRLAEQVRDLEAARAERGLQAEQLRDLNRRTVRLQEDERRRIASEIHDAVTPLITGALYQARALQLGHGRGTDQTAGLNAVGDLLERATTELHGVIFDLRPPDLDDIGVVAAIERYVEQVQRTGLNCRLEVIGDQKPLTSAVRLGIYRIVQEALHNVIRHAGADEAIVQLESAEELLRVTIRDNGVGFDPERAGGPTSLGLLSMRERASAIGASFTISSTPGGGTALVIERWGLDDVHLPAEPVVSAFEGAHAPALPNRRELSEVS